MAPESRPVAVTMPTHRYRPGEQVRVLSVFPPGHRRTPAYVRGAVGTVERVCGPFRNPEERAYGFSGEPRRWLYRVRFPMLAVWTGYTGGDRDVVDVEIYEHWLEPAPNREAYR